MHNRNATGILLETPLSSGEGYDNDLLVTVSCHAPLAVSDIIHWHDWWPVAYVAYF
jgi:hypothetical protein